MKFIKILFTFLVSGFLLVISLSSHNAHANSGGGGGGGGGAGAYIKILPMTVNLAGGTQYLRISISIKGGTPEVASQVANFMPDIRYAMLLLLCEKKGEDILTAEGKVVLQEELKHAINKAIKMNEHDGVTNVAYEDFIVQ